MNKLSKTILSIVLILGIALMVPIGVKALTDTPSVAFSDMTSARTSKGFTLSGVLNFNGVPIEELNVVLFCNNIEKTKATINVVDGSFSLLSTECYSNQDAYAEVMYKGQIVQSEHFKVPHGKSSHYVMGDTTSGATSITASTNPAGVPEFSLLTMGTAVVLVTLGLVFLRKN